MDDLQFDRHALSLYRFYRERGCLVTFQLWTTEDGGEHFKISRPPTLPFRPATKVFPNIVPLSSKTQKSPGRQRRDQRRLEQHRAAKQTGPYVCSTSECISCKTHEVLTQLPPEKLCYGRHGCVEIHWHKKRDKCYVQIIP